MALDISRRTAGSVVVLDLKGRITLGGPTGAFRDAVKTALAGGQNKALLLNLAQVDYVDSAGLGELVGVCTTATNLGASAKLLNVQQRLRDLLSITKLATVFEMYEDEAAALASFK